MKKCKKLLLLTCCLTLVLAGCSKSDNETTKATEAPSTEAVTEAETQGQEAEVPSTRTEYKALDYVTLGQYKGLEIAAADVEITEDEIQETVDSMLQNFSNEVTDRAVAEGDTVNLDYEGLEDGVAFQGGSAADAELTIGSGRFIDGFEDGLIGVMPGEPVSLNLKFPEDYSVNPDMAGKEVVFNVTVNFIKEPVTELTDELVAENFIYKTAGEYREAVRTTLYEQKVWAKAWEAISANTTINSYPVAKDEFILQQMSSLGQTAAMYGMDTATLLQSFYQMTEEAFTEEYIVPAFEEEMLIHAMAEAEGLVVTDESFQTSLEELAANNKATTDAVLSYYGETYLRESFLYKLVFDTVIGSAVIK